jgi:hypothetical protein
MSTDDSSVGLNDGMRMTVPLREVKTDEKRRRENKKCLRARVLLRQRKGVLTLGTQGVGLGMYNASMTYALHKSRRRCLNTSATN